MGRAGAKRIRFVESAWGPTVLQDGMQEVGFDVKDLASAATSVEFENTNNLGQAKSYARFKVPNPYMYPEYVLNHSYADTDVFVSMAKLKNHADCGVTLSHEELLRHRAGIDLWRRRRAWTSRTSGLRADGRRCATWGGGNRRRSRRRNCIPASAIRPATGSRASWRTWRWCGPIHLAIIDGVESMAGGEGPWIRGVRAVKPGVMIAGLNPVCTDAVATAVMGYDPARHARNEAISQRRQHHAAGRSRRGGHNRPETHRRARRLHRAGGISLRCVVDDRSQTGPSVLPRLPAGVLGGVSGAGYQAALFQLGIPRRTRRTLAAVQLAIPLSAEFWPGARGVVRPGGPGSAHLQTQSAPVSRHPAGRGRRLSVDGADATPRSAHPADRFHLVAVRGGLLRSGTDAGRWRGVGHEPGARG